MLAAIEKLLTAIPGKSYIGSIGFLAGSIYNFVVTKDYNTALAMLFAAFGITGVRTAFNKQTTDIARLTEQVAASQTNDITSNTRAIVHGAVKLNTPLDSGFSQSN